MNFFEVETGLTNDDIENRVLYLINSSEFKKWIETKSSFWKSWINEKILITYLNQTLLNFS